MTVTENLAEVLPEQDREANARYVAECLAPEKVRHGALCALLGRVAPETLRTGVTAACPDLAPMWNAWADEIELLAAHGFTGATPYEAAKIALAVGDATVDDFRNPLAYRDYPEKRRRVLALADEMDALTADGFDAEVYAKEIDQACGGAR
jgi:hypothetical protein